MTNSATVLWQNFNPTWLTIVANAKRQQKVEFFGPIDGVYQKRTFSGSGKNKILFQATIFPGKYSFSFFYQDLNGSWKPSDILAFQDGDSYLSIGSDDNGNLGDGDFDDLQAIFHSDFMLVSDGFTIERKLNLLRECSQVKLESVDSV